MFIRHKLTKVLFKIMNTENFIPGTTFIITRFINYVYSWIQIKNNFPIGKNLNTCVALLNQAHFLCQLQGMFLFILLHFLKFLVYVYLHLKLFYTYIYCIWVLTTLNEILGNR